MNPKQLNEQEQPIITRTYILNEDATLFNDSVQLHYNGLFCGPPKGICPPVEALTKGTAIRISYNFHDPFTIIKVDLAPLGDYGWLIGGKVCGITAVDGRLQEIIIARSGIEYKISPKVFENFVGPRLVVERETKGI